MSKASDAASGVMRGIQDLCDLYRVPAFRMQSGVFTIKGVGGKERPMFIGKWRDDYGEEHHGGMPDFLLTPNIRTHLDKVPIPESMQLTEAERQAIIIAARRVNIIEQVPLWVEAKANTGKLSPEQKAFSAYVERIGGYYLAVCNSSEKLEEWFKAKGVAKP